MTKTENQAEKPEEKILPVSSLFSKGRGRKRIGNPKIVWTGFGLPGLVVNHLYLE
jgi:hypothetical protein